MLQDMRFAVRLMVKNRGVTLAAVTALALGIGANATVFTLVDAVLFRGLPYEAADRIVAVSTRDEQGRPRGISYLELQDWQEGVRGFTDLAAFANATLNVSDGSQAPERYAGNYISANGFGLLRVAPMLGRDFLPEEGRPGAPAVVLLGHSVWTNRYASDPSIVGQVVRVNGVPSTVVGVMPEGFRFSNTSDLWLPLGAMANVAEQGRGVRTCK